MSPDVESITRHDNVDGGRQTLIDDCFQTNIKPTTERTAISSGFSQCRFLASPCQMNLEYYGVMMLSLCCRCQKVSGDVKMV